MRIAMSSAHALLVVLMLRVARPGGARLGADLVDARAARAGSGAATRRRA